MSSWFNGRGSSQRNAHRTIMIQVVLVVLSLLAVVPHSCCSHHQRYPPPAGNITQRRVFSAGEGGYYCFRIPALLFTDRGTLLAFAEGRGQQSGSCADHGDVHIVVKRSSDSGKTWSNLTIVYKEDDHTIRKNTSYSYLSIIANGLYLVVISSPLLRVGR